MQIYSMTDTKYFQKHTKINARTNFMGIYSHLDTNYTIYSNKKINVYTNFYLPL